MSLKWICFFHAIHSIQICQNQFYFTFSFEELCWFKIGINHLYYILGQEQKFNDNDMLQAKERKLMTRHGSTGTFLGFATVKRKTLAEYADMDSLNISPKFRLTPTPRSSFITVLG